MTRKISLGCALMVGLTLLVPASSQADWLVPKWPWSSQKKEPVRKPRLLPQRVRKPQKNVFQHIGDGTKTFFRKTGELLTPWNDHSRRRPAHRTATRPQSNWPSVPSFFSSKSKPKPKHPKTVKDFIGLPRVDP